MSICLISDISKGEIPNLLMSTDKHDTLETSFCLSGCVNVVSENCHLTPKKVWGRGQVLMISCIVNLFGMEFPFNNHEYRSLY